MYKQRVLTYQSISMNIIVRQYLKIPHNRNNTSLIVKIMKTIKRTSEKFNGTTDDRDLSLLIPTHGR